MCFVFSCTEGSDWLRRNNRSCFLVIRHFDGTADNHAKYEPMLTHHIEGGPGATESREARHGHRRRPGLARPLPRAPLPGTPRTARPHVNPTGPRQPRQPRQRPRSRGVAGCEGHREHSPSPRLVKAVGARWGGWGLTAGLMRLHLTRTHGVGLGARLAR